MSGRIESIARVTTVAALALGIGLITQRLISLSTATAGAVSRIANTAVTRITVLRPPTPAEVARLKILSDRIDVIADNLANAQTTGFKRHRADVNDGTETQVGDLTLDMNQGGLEATNASLDVAITGDGFLHVKISPMVSDGTGYTRNGAMFLDKNGDLVVSGGYKLIPPINIPSSATNISISQDGMVSYEPAGASHTARAGQILLAKFANPQLLACLHGAVFMQTVASGSPVICIPGEVGTGSLQQGYLEKSNVDPIREWAAMLKAEQSLQLNSQAIQVVDKARQVIAGLDKQ